MNRFLFKRIFEDLTRRVEKEGKKNPSWLMGYLQGLGSARLTGYQCAALVDLLLVPLEKDQPVEQTALDVEVPEQKPEAVAAVALNKLTLAQR